MCCLTNFVNHRAVEGCEASDKTRVAGFDSGFDVDSEHDVPLPFDTVINRPIKSVSFDSR